MSRLSDFLPKSGVQFDTGERQEFVAKVTDGSWLPEDGSYYNAGDFPKLHQLLKASYDNGFGAFTGPNHEAFKRYFIERAHSEISSSINSLSFSPSGDLLAVGTSFEPYLRLYSFELGGFSPIDVSFSDPLAGSARCVRFSPDGNFVAIAQTRSPYLAIYEIDGTTLTKLPNPDDLPAGFAYSLAFHPNGEILFVGHATSPYMTVYRLNGNAKPVRETSIFASMPPNTVNVLEFSSDGTVLAVGHNGAPYLTIYDVRASSTWGLLTRRENLGSSDRPAGSVQGLSFSSYDEDDVFHLSVGHDSTPFYSSYSVNKTFGESVLRNSFFGRLPTSVLPEGAYQVRFVRHSPDNTVLAIGFRTGTDVTPKTLLLQMSTAGSVFTSQQAQSVIVHQFFVSASGSVYGSDAAFHPAMEALALSTSSLGGSTDSGLALFSPNIVTESGFILPYSRPDKPNTFNHIKT